MTLPALVWLGLSGDEEVRIDIAAVEQVWLFRDVISASMHADFPMIPHESVSY
jgi:hypothetical protein